MLTVGSLLYVSFLNSNMTTDVCLTLSWMPFCVEDQFVRMNLFSCNYPLDLLSRNPKFAEQESKVCFAGATGFAVGIDCKSLPDSSQGITAKLNTLFLALEKAILNLKSNVNAY